MLRYFRAGGVAQILVGGIVFAIILVFVLEFRAGSSAQTGSLSEQCAVRYAGYCVDAKEYGAALNLIAPRGIDPKRVRGLELKAKTLEGLVERELLVEQAKRLKLAVSEQDLTRELQSWRAYVSLPASDLERLSSTLGLCPLDPTGCVPGADRGVRTLRSGSGDRTFDYKLYERELRLTANRGPREFRDMQEREMLADRMRKLVQSRVRVSDAEVAFLAQQAVIRSVQVSRSWFAKYVLDQSDDAVDRWSFEHKDQVDAAWNEEKKDWSAGCPLIREISISAPAVQLDDDKEPLKKQAEAARERVAKGEDFAAVAREVSVSDSAINGGQVGCLSKSYGIGADELLKAVESLKPHQLSNVIETPRGYHLVELLGKADEATLEATARRQIGRELYTRFAADEAAKRFAEKLLERAKAGEKLEEIVREMTDELVASQKPPKPAPGRSDGPGLGAALLAPDRPKFEVSASFGRSGNPLPDVEPKQPLAQKAFELDKPEAVYPQVIETASGWVVIQLKEFADADKLSRDKAMLKARLTEVKAQDALARYVADLKTQAGAKLEVEQSFAEEKQQQPAEE
jgi:parvulin-like peptidyl-prolyl isomerase